MKIEFRKIANKPKPINFLLNSSNSALLDRDENISLDGELIKKYSNLVEFSGKIFGKLNLICAKSGENFIKHINEDLVLYFSDGIWEIQSQTNDINCLDIIEFFEGFIDFKFIIESEIESIRLDYNIKE